LTNSISSGKLPGNQTVRACSEPEADGLSESFGWEPQADAVAVRTMAAATAATRVVDRILDVPFIVGRTARTSTPRPTQ
jgi:hypothetical protein